MSTIALPTRLLAADFARDRIALLSFWLLAALLFCALAAPWLAPQNPYDLAQLDILDAKLAPGVKSSAGSTYWLGTDDQGRDMLSAILYGSRVSLMIGLAAIVLSVTTGVLLGLLAGFRGGWVEAVIMRLADIQLTVPAILIALTLDGVARVALPKDVHDSVAIWVLVLSIGFAYWPQFARVTRATTLAEKNKDYVNAARIIGVPGARIALTHVLPNAWGPVLERVASALVSWTA